MISFTTPLSRGWITLIWPDGMIRPFAVATISSSPRHAQTIATATRATMAPIVIRPAGEVGVSVISIAAGRNSSSGRVRRSARRRERGTSLRSGGIGPPGLQPIELGIAAAELDQGLVRSLFDQ